MAQLRELELTKDISILFDNEIVIYGGGRYGRLAINLLKEFGLNVLCVCDSNAEKWGELIDDKYSIISPIELNELKRDKKIIVIIAINNSQYVNHVLRTLDYCGVGDIACYTYFALKYTLMVNCESLSISELTRKKRKYLKAMCLKKRISSLSDLSGFYAINNVLFNNAVLVYQAAKVGSTTVYDSLVKSGVSAEHIHFINGSDFLVLLCQKQFMQTEETRMAIEVLRGLEKVKIITLVREPISRDISQFFHEVDDYIIYYNRKCDIPNMLEGLVEMININSGFRQLGYQFEWFNTEIKEVFDVNIYEHDFDREKGYQIICDKNVEILIIKAEKLNDCEKIIGEFVGADCFKLETKNVGAEKLYHFAYSEAKRELKIPRYIVDRYYKNNIAMDHFYTELEKAAFLKRWEKNIIDE